MAKISANNNRKYEVSSSFDRWKVSIILITMTLKNEQTAVSEIV